MSRTEATLSFPQRIDELDAPWLSRRLAMGEISSLRSAPLGAGTMAHTIRLHLTWRDHYSQPETVVVKLASTDPAARRSAAQYRSYEVEVRFYEELAPGIDARLPHCYWAQFDHATGNYIAVLEDIDSGTPGDQFAGCDADEASAALAELALVHGPRWADPTLDTISWLNRYPVGFTADLSNRLQSTLADFFQRYDGRLSPEVAELINRFAQSADRYDRKGVNGPRSITHGDFRNDNLLFGTTRVCIVDWQSVHLGAPLQDVSYFLGCGLPTEARQRNEINLLREYHARLLSFGIDLKWDDCLDEYRRHSFAALSTALIASTAVTLSAQADALLLTIVERAGAQAIDLDAETLLN